MMEDPLKLDQKIAYGHSMSRNLLSFKRLLALVKQNY